MTWVKEHYCLDFHDNEVHDLDSGNFLYWYIVASSWLAPLFSGIYQMVVLYIVASSTVGLQFSYITDCSVLPLLKLG